MNMKIQSPQHAKNWLKLYNTHKYDVLLHDLAKTSKGCTILQTTNPQLLLEPDDVEFHRTMVEEQLIAVNEYLENDLLNSDYQVIEATDKLKDWLTTI